MTLTLPAKEARLIVWEEDEDWEKVQNTEEITSNSRWSIFRTAIFRHIPSSKFYSFDWSSGATECQDEKPYEYEKEVKVTEVVEKEVVVKQWVPV